MTTVISKNMVISEGVVFDAGNAGVVGWQNIANTANATVTSETAAGPLSNVFNDSTAFFWQASSTATQTITITAGGVPVDYIGIARHNLTGATVEIKYDGVTIIPATAIDSQSTMFLTAEASPTTITITIAGATTAPKIAVLRAGLSIRLQRNIYVGHTPITYGRNRIEVSAMSENGEYLGRILRGETRSTEVTLQNLTPDWYRAYLDPWIASREPCFFAWRPVDYPAEVNYCWIEGDTRPVNSRSNGMMDVSFNLKGMP